MLTLIKDRLTRSVFDDVMEVAWSTMWNVTDETAINCKRFLEGRGMEYFLKCLHVSLEEIYCIQRTEDEKIEFYKSIFIVVLEELQDLLWGSENM